MRELIFVTSNLIFFIGIIAFIIVFLVNIPKERTTRIFKVFRNLCAIVCISQLLSIMSISAFTLTHFIVSMLISLMYLIAAVYYHKNMITSTKAKEYLKPHPIDIPIDVEFREL